MHTTKFHEQCKEKGPTLSIWSFDHRHKLDRISDKLKPHRALCFKNSRNYSSLKFEIRIELNLRRTNFQKKKRKIENSPREMLKFQIITKIYD